MHSDITGLDDIIAHLGQEGCSVEVLPFLPDREKKTPTGTFLLVSRLGMNWLFLYKDQVGRPSMQVATPTERTWLEDFRGQVQVVENLAQITGTIRLFTE